MVLHIFFELEHSLMVQNKHRF